MPPISRQDRAGGLFTGESKESGGGIVFGPLEAKTPRAHARLKGILPVKPPDRGLTIVDIVAAVFFAFVFVAFFLNVATSCVDRLSKRADAWAAQIERGK